MRDGVKLPTIISLPGNGSNTRRPQADYPTVLTRGYSAGGLSNYAGRFNEAGYAFVSQQCRGNGGSDGTRFFPDDKDRYDTIEWNSKQPWSNGKVAMWGGSYWGATQWRAVVAQPPGLKAIIPGYINADHWKYGYCSCGAIQYEPPIKIQVRHGRWRMENNWPLDGTKFTDYYLSSPDGSRVGSLNRSLSGKEHPTTYNYDPDNPVLTLGANGSHSPVQNLITVGPTDQRANESREDVLVYSTPELRQDIEVIGPVEAGLFAASSAKDTDFTIKLIDVYPDGRGLNATEGIVRAHFRNSIWDKPSLIEPGKIYEYKIELLPIAIIFRRGHRVRIHVSSSSWPLWDRNQNTGNPIGMDAKMILTRQTVYHDKAHPSRIILPVIPNDELR